MTTTKTLTDEQMNDFGNSLAVAMYLKRDREYKDRWQTAWGTKTGLGLYLTLRNLIENSHLAIV